MPKVVQKMKGEVDTKFLNEEYRRLTLEVIRIINDQCKICNKNSTGKEVSECVSCDVISHVKCLPKSLRQAALSGKMKCDSCVRNPPPTRVALEVAREVTNSVIEQMDFLDTLGDKNPKDDEITTNVENPEDDRKRHKDWKLS